jgi:hypothetical protein
MKKDLKKKKMVGIFTPAGTLPESYTPLPEDEERWVDINDGSQVRLSEIMEYYAKHYRWNPLADEENICFHGRGAAAEHFWKSITQGKAIEFYQESMKTTYDGDALDLLAERE